jgi:hypothetical protein
MNTWCRSSRSTTAPMCTGGRGETDRNRGISLMGDGGWENLRIANGITGWCTRETGRSSAATTDGY